MRRLNFRSKWNRLLLFFGSFVLGLTLTSKFAFKLSDKSCKRLDDGHDQSHSKATRSQVAWLPTSTQTSNIYVGMMSAGKYLENRVQRALDTWLQKGSWKVEVFADGDVSQLSVPSELDFKVVVLPSVDDKAYPPQKKCFMMIRHMADEHIDNYDWFLRVDDDAYLDYPRLKSLLSTINSSLPVFFGTPGFGMDPDDGMEVGMYYLMGGPGMIFSRGLLRLLRSHLSYCVQHMFSPHEDIEIGRCVWKHVQGRIIPKAWETIEFFYQQYDKVTGDVVNIVLDDLSERRTLKTVSYHAVKKEDLLYQLHKLVLARKVQKLLNRTAAQAWEMRRMDALLRLDEAVGVSPKHQLSDLPIIFGAHQSQMEVPNSSDEKWPENFPWTPPSPIIPRYSSQLVWLNWDKYYGHQNDDVVPMKGHSKREQTTLWKWMEEVENRFLKDSCPHFGKEVHFVNGYLKRTAYDGVYLFMTYRSFSNNGLQYCNIMVQVGYGVVLSNELSTTSLLTEVHKVTKCPKNRYNRGPKQPTPAYCNDSLKQPNVVVVIPLQGRYKALKRFMEDFEKNFLQPRARSPRGIFKDRLIQLVIVLLGGIKDELGLNEASSNLLKSYQRTYGSSLIRYHVADTGDRDFSRGAGIQLGSLAANSDDILFFMDIDMIVTPDLLQQCRVLASKEKTAWYPISFSQYDPERLCYDGGLARSCDNGPLMVDMVDPGEEPGQQHVQDRITDTPLVISEERGFWRDFGYGIACMYKSDFIRAGGFDLSIEGWGEEDIRMYLSLLKSGLDVFRSKQVDLIHIHHTKICDKSLEGEQALSCQRTKASHYASRRCLAKTYFSKIQSKKS